MAVDSMFTVKQISTLTVNSLAASPALHTHLYTTAGNATYLRGFLGKVFLKLQYEVETVENSKATTPPE